MAKIIIGVLAFLLLSSLVGNILLFRALKMEDSLDECAELCYDDEE